jgi:predicted Fe-Mo cluster-binding NifX family protein
MKIAISSPSGEPESEFSGRFGRCQYFLLFDTADASWMKVANPARDAQGGAGARVVQFLTDHGVEAVISGRYGPTAFSALEASGIKPYLADSGTPADLVAGLDQGDLKLAAGPTGEGRHQRGRRGLGK